MKGVIFTYLMTIAGTGIALFRPFIGLLVYICFGIIKPDALWGFSLTEGNYSRIVFVGSFIGWVFAGFGNWQFGRARIIVASLAAYLLWCCVSALGAPNQQLAWQTAELAAKIVIPILIGVTLIGSVDQLKQLVWVIVVSQGYLAYEFNLSYYQGFNRLVRVGFAGMDEKTVAISMVVGASLALFLALDTTRWYLKAVALISAILMIHVPLLAYSRGGMLALIISSLVAIWLVPKRPKHLAALALVVLVGLRLAGPVVREKFSTSFAEQEELDDSAQSRLTLWGQAWETMLRHPLVGVGPRHWGWWAQTNYGWNSQKEAHNTWLQIGAELGFPGAAALVLFFIVPVRRAWPMARAQPVVGSDTEANLARMVVCSLAGFGVASQFITVYGVELPYYVVLMSAGLLKVQDLAPARKMVFVSTPANERSTTLPNTGRAHWFP